MRLSSGFWGGIGLWFLVYHSVSTIVRRPLASQVLAPAGGRTESRDRALRIPVSHGRPRVCISFLLVHQAWYRIGFLQQIRGHPQQKWSAQILTFNGAAILSALIMLSLCCSFASAFFTSRIPSSLSVDRLNSKVYTICNASLIATLSESSRLPLKRFMKKDTGSPSENTVSPDFFWQVLSPLLPVPSPPDLSCCRF